MQVIFAVGDLTRLRPLADRASGKRAARFAEPDGNVVAVAEPARVAAAIE